MHVTGSSFFIRALMIASEAWISLVQWKMRNVYNYICTICDVFVFFASLHLSWPDMRVFHLLCYFNRYCMHGARWHWKYLLHTLHYTIYVFLFQRKCNWLINFFASHFCYRRRELDWCWTLDWDYSLLIR